MQPEGYCGECGTVLDKGPPCKVCEVPTCTGCTEGDTCVWCLGVCPRCGLTGYGKERGCWGCQNQIRFGMWFASCVSCRGSVPGDVKAVNATPRCPQCGGHTCVDCRRALTNVCLRCQPLTETERAEECGERVGRYGRLRRSG